jgi:AcrR family transcriptional regulator
VVAVLPTINLDNYTPERILGAQLIATKDESGMTMANIASECGVDTRTIFRWQNDPLFIDLLLYYSELSMEAFTVELYGKLKQAVRQGSTRAMELVLKNRGKLIDKKEVSGNLNLSVEQTLSLTQDVLLTEIEELKRKVLASSQKALPPTVIEAEYEIL